MAAPVLALERLDALSREAAPERAGLVELTPSLLAALAGSWARPEQILRALGFVRLRNSDPAEASLWRRRAMAPRAQACSVRRRRGVAWEAATNFWPTRASTTGAPPRPRSGRGRRLSEAPDTCRVDVWLWRARFFKTRSLAARIVEGGGVRLCAPTRGRPSTNRAARCAAATF